MPKSPTAPSDPVARMTDVALRKKKNADAQAAFRARRANYIATLEASVTNLESVVLELQDSLRRVKHERDGLHFQIKEHAKYCNGIYPARHRGQMLNEEQMSSSSPFSDSQCGTSSQSTPHLHPFNNLHYRDEGPAAYTNTASSHGPDYTASSLQNDDLTPDTAGSSGHLHRAGGKYGAQYPYAMTESPRDMRNGWQVPMLNPAMHGGDGVMGGPHSQSPGYMNSSSMTSGNEQVPEFAGRINVEDSKASVGPSHDGVFAEYLGPRSANPSSAIHLSAPIPMTSSLAPFTFPDQPQHGGGEFDYRQPPTDNSLPGQQRLSGRRISNEVDIQDLDEEDLDMNNLRRRDSSSPRPPSPARPSISCTVSVIRAQSFGALRRTRASAKKSTEAARITLDVLHSRGIGLRDPDLVSKQPLLTDDGHHSTNTP